MKRWQEVYDFWIGEKPEPAKWFKKDPALDGQIRAKFGPWLEHFDPNDFAHWRVSPKSMLSLVILLDQFPRNAFRGDARSFAYDAYALEAAREALEKGFDTELSAQECMFLILPFEHSEDITDQKEAVRLARDMMERGLAKEIYDYAVKHHDIIERFGRFPHRNAVLGRASTPEEIAFLKTPGSSF